MSVHPLTQEGFEACLRDNAIVFVDFWAPWCAPCKHFGTIYEKVAATFTQVHFASVNIEEQQELAEWFEIRSIPHLVVFKEGIAIYSDAGSMPESTLVELVEQALVVDMSEHHPSGNSDD